MRLFVTVLVLFYANGSPIPDVSSLQLVQILFRHGDRSPTHTYPSDPYQESFWPQGFGQLTKAGKEEMYEVGQYIRSRYIDTGYLSSDYKQTEIHVRSTDKDRTLMSAYLVLAGLYPPEGSQLWNSTIPWQPIPVHTLPLAEDFVLALPCPSYDKLFAEMMNSPPILKIQEKYKPKICKNYYTRAAPVAGTSVISLDCDAIEVSEITKLISYVSQHSGLKPTLTDLLEMTDPVTCEKKNNLPFPDWLKNDNTAEKIIQLNDLKAQLRFREPVLAKIKGGPLLGRMTENMRNLVTNKNITRKAFFYSGHDTTINAFLNTLKMFNGLYIPTGTLVFVELHMVNEKPVVKIYYRNSTMVDPYLLTIPGCADPCPLSQFESLAKPMIPDNPQASCEGSDITSQQGVTGTTLAVTILTLLVLAFLFLILGVNTLRERRRQALYRYSPVNQHM